MKCNPNTHGIEKRYEGEKMDNPQPKRTNGGGKHRDKKSPNGRAHLLHGRKEQR